MFSVIWLSSWVSVVQDKETPRWGGGVALKAHDVFLHFCLAIVDLRGRS